MAKSLGVLTPEMAKFPASGAPAYVYTAGTNHTFSTLDFDGGSTVETIYFQTVVPQSYTTNANFELRVYWTTAAGASGNVVWQGAYVKLSDDAVWDSAVSSYVTVTDGVTAAQDLMIAGAIAFTSVTMTAGDALVIAIKRDPTDGSDSMAADAKFIFAEIRES